MRKAGDHRAERRRRHVDHTAPFTRAHAGNEADVTRKVPSRLIESTCRQSAKVMAANSFCGKMPAQFTTMSTWLNLPLTSLAMAATDGSEATSHLTAIASRPGGLHQLDGVAAVAEIDNRDMHAVFRQPLGKGLPDAVGRAGDDGNFVFVAIGHRFPRGLKRRSNFCRHPRA